MTFRHTDALALATQLDLANIEKPAALVRGLEVADNLARAQVLHPVDLLALPDDELESYFDNRVTREAAFSRSPAGSVPAWSQTHELVLDELFAQVRAAMLPHVDGLIDELRAPFDGAAAKLTAYVNQFGFTSHTSADDVIDRDAKTIAAFRELPALIRTMQPYAAIRRMLSTSLDLSPSVAERRSIAERSGSKWSDRDWSILYAAGDQWSVDASTHLDRNPQASLDWLLLARGGLALNSPDVVRAKIASRGTLQRDPDFDALDDDGLDASELQYRYPAP